MLEYSVATNSLVDSFSFTTSLNRQLMVILSEV